MSEIADFVTQIDSLPDLVATEARRIDDRMRLLLTTPQIYGIRQVILLGSGDSFFASEAVAPAIRAWTGLPVTAMLAMEAARYLDAGVPAHAARARGLLAVSISSSGEAARVVEATHRLRRLGAATLAITANPESRLALAAEHVLSIAIPASTPAPGTRSYAAALLAGWSLGIRLAEVRMTLTMDQANALRAELAGAGPALALACRASREPAAALAEAWHRYRAADVLGSGPALASAGYGAAKLIEAAGIHAAAQDAEEFHHLNYFVSAPAETPAILFAPSRGRAASRTDELAETLAALGRPTFIVTDSADAAGPGTRLVLPALSEWFAPLIHTVPAALLAAHWAARLGVTHYRGHTGAWHRSSGAALVRNSPLDI